MKRAAEWSERWKRERRAAGCRIQTERGTPDGWELDLAEHEGEDWARAAGDRDGWREKEEEWVEKCRRRLVGTRRDRGRGDAGGEPDSDHPWEDL